ncbi:Proteasome subunit alpha type-6 [Thelohanellus kitauei]|uniref:Proteasome subunit alpha type-6 n=1 Tax=Thelohanellus kitauei TaxID=669202 RepID=A0A0C2N1E0_THEKT|nr:Proteasome subunit alpha type-6 [Thelohanellus kitauei]
MSRSTSAGFDRMITVFSPEGRLYQIEYAFKPIVNSNVTAVAVKGLDSAVIACQKKVQDKLLDPSMVTNMSNFNDRVGGCFIGLKADFLSLATRCKYEAQVYEHDYGVQMPCDILSNRIGSLNQVHTQVAGQRPLGCCIIMIGIDDECGAMLYKVDPSGLSVPFRAISVGAKQSEANALLERKLKKHPPLTKKEVVELALTVLLQAIGADLRSTDLEVAEVSFQDPLFK